MALEALNEIKKAEEEANKIIQVAISSSKELVKNAVIDAENQFQKIIEIAKKEQEKILKQAEEEGAKEAEPILKKGEEEIAKIKNLSDEKKNNAINLIVERIVKIHGNS